MIERALTSLSSAKLRKGLHGNKLSRTVRCQIYAILLQRKHKRWGR